MTLAIPGLYVTRPNPEGHGSGRHRRSPLRKVSSERPCEDVGWAFNRAIETVRDGQDRGKQQSPSSGGVDHPTDMGEGRDDDIVHKIDRIAPAPAPFEQRGRGVTFERRNFLHQPEEDKDRKDSERCWVANQHRRDRRINECFGSNRKKDGGYTPAPNRPRQVGKLPRRNDLGAGTAQQPRWKCGQPDHLSRIIPSRACRASD